MLIARVSLHIQVKRVRGLQYRYSGHTVCFMQNTIRMVTKLPLLPTQLNLVLLKPRNHNQNPHLQSRYAEDFRVRKNHIIAWLRFLKEHHPGYVDIELDEEALSALPCDSDISDNVTALEDPEPSTETAEPIPEGEEAPEISAVVPNLAPLQSERDLLADQIEGLRTHLTMPSVRSTPINNFGSHERLFSIAFPTLFPKGEADYAAPRYRSVTLSAWAAHLMRYHDRRFATHPQFRYVVFNQILREQAFRASKWLVANDSDSRNLTLEELQEALDASDDSALLRKIVRQGSSIHGTRPFWNQKRHELMAIARSLPSQSLFTTFSAADHQWHDLQRHMPQYDEYLAATSDHERARIVRNNIQNQPHIAAYYFHRRVQLFLKHVLLKKFPSDDYWYRYEWQGRGSSHTHGFLWVNIAPIADMSSAESRVAFVNFWKNYITAFNPDIQRRPDARHPSALPFNEQVSGHPIAPY
jgi:ATP-dependent DNA helicase PIF1